MCQKNWRTILLLLFFVFFFLAITGTPTSGYHFADDHEIIRIDNDLKSESLTRVAFNWINADLSIRFRPLYYLHRVIETKIFGTNLLFWSLYNGLLAFFTFSFFYLGLRKLTFSNLEAIAFLILAFLGPQTEIWWRLGPNETIGLVFLSLSFYFMARCLIIKNYNLNNFLFVFFLILSSLCKESFIIIIPAFIIYKIWNEKNIFNTSLKKSARQNLISIIPLSVVFIEIFFLIPYIGRNLLGNTSINFNLAEKIPGIFSIIKNLKYHLFTIISLIGIIYLKIKNKKIFVKFLASLNLPLTFCLLIIIPNIILYSKTGMEEGRYLVPTTIGLSFFIISLVKNLNNYTPSLKSLSFIIIFILSLNPTLNALKYGYYFSLQGHINNSFLSSISENSQNKNTKILIVVDSFISNEYIHSLKIYLTSKNITNLHELALNDVYNSNSKSEKIETQNQPDMIIFLDKNLSERYFQYSMNNPANFKNPIKDSLLFAIYTKNPQ